MELKTQTVQQSLQVLRTVMHAENLAAFRASIERGRKAAATTIENALVYAAVPPAAVTTSGGAYELMELSPAAGLQVATECAPEAIQHAVPVQPPPRPVMRWQIQNYATPPPVVTAARLQAIAQRKP
jgi:hypothetical protein